MERGIPHAVFLTGCIRWDIDVSRDISAVLRHGRGTRTYRELRLLGIDRRIRDRGFSDTFTALQDSPDRR
jgi:hypothetical protein